MFCKKCGKEIDNEAAICTTCGYPTKNYLSPKKVDKIKTDKEVKKVKRTVEDVAIENDDIKIKNKISGWTIAAFVLCLVLNIVNFFVIIVASFGFGNVVLMIIAGSLLAATLLLAIITTYMQKRKNLLTAIMLGLTVAMCVFAIVIFFSTICSAHHSILEKLMQ